MQWCHLKEGLFAVAHSSVWVEEERGRGGGGNLQWHWHLFADWVRDLTWLPRRFSLRGIGGGADSRESVLSFVLATPPDWSTSAASLWGVAGALPSCIHIKNI